MAAGRRALCRVPRRRRSPGGVDDDWLGDRCTSATTTPTRTAGSCWVPGSPSSATRSCRKSSTVRSAGSSGLRRGRRERGVSDPLGRVRSVHHRLLDACRRCERRGVRLSQPRVPDRRRACTRGREPQPSLPRAGRRSRPCELAGPGARCAGGAGRRAWEEADAIWSGEPGEAIVVVTADCVPVALARADGAPAVALAHVGWRGLLPALSHESRRRARRLPRRGRGRPGHRIRAASRSARTSPSQCGRRTDTICSGRVGSTSPARSSARSTPPVASGSIASTSAPRVIPSGTSPTAATGESPGARGDRSCRLIREDSRALRSGRRRSGAGRAGRRRDEVRRARGNGRACRGRVPVVGENRAQDLAAQARVVRRRVPLALHRPPAEPDRRRSERAPASSSTRSTRCRRLVGSRSPRLCR